MVLFICEIGIIKAQDEFNTKLIFRFNVVTREGEKDIGRYGEPGSFGIGEWWHLNGI